MIFVIILFFIVMPWGETNGTLGNLMFIMVIILLRSWSQPMEGDEKEDLEV